MEKVQLYCWSGMGLALTLIWTYGFTYWILAITFCVAGFYYGIMSVVAGGKKRTPTSRRPPTNVTDALAKLMEQQRKFHFCSRKTVTTKNLDVAIQELMDLIAQDYIVPWYKDIAQHSEKSVHLIQDDLWILIAKFCNRLLRIDWVSFLARDVVNALTRHFHEVKLANQKPSSPSSHQPHFILHPWLSSPEKEEQFLREVTDVFLIYLLPEQYIQCDPLQHLLREILACSVFGPGVSIICDPDYLNQKIYDWLDYKEHLATEQTRTFAYAATYEEFMKMIKLNQDVEYLKSLRYNIISEIMQATTIQNLKRAKGLDTDRESSPKGTSKGDLLKARNLKRYLNQLSVTKSYCEKRIHFLGGPDYQSASAADADIDLVHLPGRKILSFEVIMETPEARQHFSKYLYRLGQESLHGFWAAIENMKFANKRNWHHMATEIYQMFVTPSVSQVKSCLERSTLRNMESFIVGDTGPDAFWEAQKQIFNTLEERHYPSFILSDIYHHYITLCDDSQPTPEASPSTAEKGSPLRSSTFNESTSMRTRRITLHSTYAQEKLTHLDEKLSNKTQALKALKSQKSDAKIQRLQEEIEREIAAYKLERNELVAHIAGTDLWAVNLGRWKAVIHSSQMQAGQKDPSFVIIVHLPELIDPSPDLDSAYGWSVTRTLDDFKALRRELCLISPALKKQQLPKMHKFKRRSINSEFLGKMSAGLQSFLELVLEDEFLSQSEAVFAFFSPSPEYLKSAPDVGKSRDPVSFPNLFKNLSVKHQDSDSEDDLLFEESESGKVKGNKDWIAEPLYMLIGEVFELKGVFKWLRRSLIAFVQVTFGSSINRQVKETVHWILSEPQLIYYLHSFRDAYWPEGKLADKAPSRTDEEKLRTRLLAKQKILQSIPDALKNLVGEANAKHGTIKVFEYLQDVRLNKHLFYILLQAFLFELFPELHHFDRLEMEDERKRREDDLHGDHNSSEDELNADRSPCASNVTRNASHPAIPTSKLHNSSVYWLRL